MKVQTINKFQLTFHEKEKTVLVRENGKFLDAEIKYTKPDFKTASIILPRGQFLIHKTGFLNSEIYIKRKFRKTPGFDMIYNWRMNDIPLTLSRREYYLVPLDFEGKKYAWLENKILHILEYEIPKEGEIWAEKENETGVDLFLLLTGFFIIFQRRNKNNNL